MNIRELFKAKAEKLEVQEKWYIHKTVEQSSHLARKHRDEVKRKMTVFIDSEDRSFCQVLFNEIAGYVQDYGRTSLQQHGQFDEL